jgi:hypothetical protein
MADAIPLRDAHEHLWYTSGFRDPAAAATPDIRASETVSLSSVGRIWLPNGTAVPVRRAFANVAASQTDEEIIPANASAAIRIISLAMVTGGTATNVTIKSKESGESSVAITPLFANAANGGAVLPLNLHGWAQTPDVARAVTVTTGAGSTTGITLSFIEIPSDCFDLL